MSRHRQNAAATADFLEQPGEALFVDPQAEAKISHGLRYADRALWSWRPSARTISTMGRGGSMDDRTMAEAADGVRRILAAIDAEELSCSAAHRNRLQGALVALESLARAHQTSVTAVAESTV